MFQMVCVCWLQPSQYSPGQQEIAGGNKIFCIRLPEEQLWNYKILFDGLVQDCSDSIANALELLHSCSKLSP